MFKEILLLLDWLRVKLFLRVKRSKIFFQEREVWWCNIGMNIGSEIFGKGDKFVRPVLILKKFNADAFFGIPLTSIRKSGTWYVPIMCDRVEGSAILNQARSLDAKRLMKRIEMLDSSGFQRVKQSFLDFYGF